MSDLTTLEALEARLGLLREPGSESELIDHAAAFTRAAAWELRAGGWANIRKTTGTERQGLDVDKLIHRTTLEIVDIVLGAGAPGQRVQWLPAGRGTPSLVVDPRPPDGEEPAPAPEPTDVVELLEHIRDLVDTIDDTAQAMLEQQTATRTAVNHIRDVVERAAARFDI